MALPLTSFDNKPTGNAPAQADSHFMLIQQAHNDAHELCTAVINFAEQLLGQAPPSEANGKIPMNNDGVLNALANDASMLKEHVREAFIRFNEIQRAVRI